VSGWVGGVLGGVDDVNDLRLDEIYLKNLQLNVGVREIFANRFVHMFSSYDHFLSQPRDSEVSYRLLTFK
jgi:hypothetical protein